jgi:hypothetical protein
MNAQALARAFRRDPAVCYLLPDPNRRERAIRFAFSCCLETTAPRNLPFYTRHGFRVVAETDVPGGPHL